MQYRNNEYHWDIQYSAKELLYNVKEPWLVERFNEQLIDCTFKNMTSFLKHCFDFGGIDNWKQLIDKYDKHPPITSDRLLQKHNVKKGTMHIFAIWVFFKLGYTDFVYQDVYRFTHEFFCLKRILNNYSLPHNTNALLKHPDKPIRTLSDVELAFSDLYNHKVVYRVNKSICDLADKYQFVYPSSFRGLKSKDIVHPSHDTDLFGI